LAKIAKNGGFIMVSSNNNFEYDLKFGQIWEQKIADILLNEKIEVKTERNQWKQTKNIVIERAYKGKPSGLASTEASYWLHILDIDGVMAGALLFRTDVLKKVLNAMPNPNKVKGGDDNASELILVSLTELMELLTKVDIGDLNESRSE
tara:strand:+ start:3989 stop:4435 length:447 start_codon:yes stop_codon:yes gene_type:complete